MKLFLDPDMLINDATFRLGWYVGDVVFRAGKFVLAKTRSNKSWEDGKTYLKGFIVRV